MIALCSLQPLSQLPPPSKPEHQTVSELLPQAFQEIQAYLRQQPTANTSVCAFELFRRAIGQRDEQAWCGLYELYHGVVSSWILHRSPALVAEDLASLVNDAFAKFSRAIGPERLQDFLSVSAFLAYLKCCAASVQSDHCRDRQARQHEESLTSLDQEPMIEDFTTSVIDSLTAQEVWAVIARTVTTHEERLILALVCVRGWSTPELQRRYPLVFPSVEDVYRIKRNVMERLRRNKELLQLLERQSSRTSREGRHAS